MRNHLAIKYLFTIWQILFKIFFKNSKIHGVIGLKASPRDVASRIKEHLPSSDLIEKVEIAGPGFLNIWISRKYCQSLLGNILTRGVLPPRLSRKLKVVVDFSSPNIAKEMHVGHLRWGKNACYEYLQWYLRTLQIWTGLFIVNDIFYLL